MHHGNSHERRDETTCVKLIEMNTFVVIMIRKRQKMCPIRRPKLLCANAFLEHVLARASLEVSS